MKMKKELNKKVALKQQSEQQVKNFVQDQFFETGHWWLKTRQIIVNVCFLAFLVFPIGIFITFLTNHHVWHYLRWNYETSFSLTRHLNEIILYLFVIVLVASLALVWRNNILEQKVYPQKATFNVQKMNQRKEIMERMYETRFGAKSFREATRYYVVEREQNLPNQLVPDLFKAGKVEIK